MASHSKESDQRAKNMGEDSGKLKLSDCICPICMYILIDPVTMPCRHELCMPCFKQNVQEASLTCPMCRTRISIWARKAARNNRLVNEKRWREIQEAFPKKVKNRLDGVEDDYSSDEEMGAPVLKQLAQPGEIRQEYEEQLQKLRAERRLREREEAEASERLIKELQEEEIRIAEERRQQLEELAAQDEAIAKELAEQLNELNSSTQLPSSNPDLTKSAQKSLPRTLLDKFVKRGTRNASNSNSPMGAGKTNYGGQTGEDKYPYTCISPWEKDEDKKSDTSKAEDIFSPASHRSTSSNNTVDYVYIDSRPCSVQDDRKESDSTSHAAGVPVVGMTEDIHTHGTPIDVVGLDDVVVLEPETVPMDPLEEVEEICNKEPEDDEDESKSHGSRSGSEGSTDSITQELVHFKPIQACPKTPPRRLPGGKVVDPPLIRSTPTNLNRTGITSPSQPQCFSPDNPAGSPIMQKRLMALAAERQEQVRILSKGTSTDTEEDPVAMDHCYSSPTKRPSLSSQTSIPAVPEVPCLIAGHVSSKGVCNNPQVASGNKGKVTIQQLLQRKKNVTATESSACATSRKLSFERVEPAQLPVVIPDKMDTDDTLQLLPLESNLEEDDLHIVPDTLKQFHSSLLDVPSLPSEKPKPSIHSPGNLGNEKWLNDGKSEIFRNPHNSFGSGDSLQMVHPVQPPGLSPLNLSAKKGNNGDSSKKDSQGSIRQWLVNQPTDGASPNRPTTQGTPPKWVSLLNSSHSVSENMKSGTKNPHTSRMPPLPSLQPSVLTTFLTPGSVAERQKEVALKTYIERTPMIIEKLKQKCPTPPSNMTSTKYEVKEVKEHKISTPSSSIEYMKSSHLVFESGPSSGAKIQSLGASGESKSGHYSEQETNSFEATNIGQKMAECQLPNHQTHSPKQNYEQFDENLSADPCKAIPGMSVPSQNQGLCNSSQQQIVALTGEAVSTDIAKTNSDMSACSKIVAKTGTNDSLELETEYLSKPLPVSKKSKGSKSPRKPASATDSESDSPLKKKGRKRKLTGDKKLPQTECLGENFNDLDHSNNGEMCIPAARRPEIQDKSRDLKTKEEMKTESFSEYLLPVPESDTKVMVNGREDQPTHSRTVNGKSKAPPQKISSLKQTKTSKKSLKNKKRNAGSSNIKIGKGNKSKEKSSTKTRESSPASEGKVAGTKAVNNNRSPTKRKNMISNNSSSDCADPAVTFEENMKSEQSETALEENQVEEGLTDSETRMKLPRKMRGKKGTKRKTQINQEKCDGLEIPSPSKGRRNRKCQRKKSEEMSSVQEVDDEVSFHIKQTPDESVDVYSSKDPDSSPQKLSGVEPNQSDIDFSPRKRKRGRPMKKRRGKRKMDICVEQEDEVEITPRKEHEQEYKNVSPGKIDQLMDSCSEKDSIPQKAPKHKARSKRKQKDSAETDILASPVKETNKDELVTDTQASKKQRNRRGVGKRWRKGQVFLEDSIPSEIPGGEAIPQETCNDGNKEEILMDARKSRKRCVGDTSDSKLIKMEEITDSDLEGTPRKKAKLKNKGKYAHSKLDETNSDMSPEKDKTPGRGRKDRMGQTVDTTSDLESSRSPTNSSSENTKSPAKKKLHQLKRRGRKGRSARDKCVYMEIVDESSRDVLDVKSDGDDSSVQESPKGKKCKRRAGETCGNSQIADKKQPTLPSKELEKLEESEILLTPNKGGRGKQRYHVEYTPDSTGKRKKRVLTDVLPEKPVGRKTRGNKGPIQTQTMLQFVTITKGKRKSDEIDSLSHVRQLPFTRGHSSSPSRSSTSSMTRSDRTGKDISKVSFEICPKQRSGSTSTLQSTAGSDLVKPDETRKGRSDFKTDRQYRAYLEEQDRLMALQLQADFDMEAKLNLTAIRRKGSEGEYDFRGKKMDFSLYFSDNDIRMTRPTGLRKGKK